MPLTIFETDPDAKPKPRATDCVGRFHSGRMVGHRPEALPEWRVTTDDFEVAEAIAQLYGGAPAEFETSSDFFIEVLTNAKSVPVILEDQSAIYADMKLWNRNTLVHHCDGSRFLSPEERKGTPCGCPTLFAERKEAARNFMGPSPSITIFFQLADDPDLGKFKFVSGSWSLASVLHEYEAALERIAAPAVAELGLELVSYTTKKGRRVEYIKPVLNRIRSYNDAIAED